MNITPQNETAPLRVARIFENINSLTKIYPTAKTKARFSRKPLIVDIYDTNPPTRIYLMGRNAWAFLELKKAGVSGCTPINQPAPRWSAYVFNLRRAGLNIETVTESHGGTYAGHHARYVLRSCVKIVGGGNV